MLIFGPVPSRCLGRSLGINNIPPKACSYSCVYCQVGPTGMTEIARRKFYSPGRIFGEVEKHLVKVQARGEQVDYLTFVPDGEPTLDLQLSETINCLRPLGIPIAIISNASLIWHEAVRETLAMADWVSLKVDAIEKDLWRKINQPHTSLDHQAILDGMLTFASEFKGILVTESMLINDLNDTDQAASEVVRFLKKLAPDTAYLSVPTRPPAETHIHAPDEAALNRIFQIINQHVNHLKLMTGYEGNAFASTGDVAEDLLSITSAHPMQEEAVRELFAKTGANWSLVGKLLEEGRLIKTEYGGRNFYVRHLQHISRNT